MDRSGVMSVSVIILFTAFSVSLGCLCFPKHVQQRFCDADYAIRALVKTAVEHDLRRQYSIDVQMVFKSNAAFQNVSHQYLYTARTSCEARLLENTEYLIIGHVISGHDLNIDFCNFPEPWDSLSLTQQHGVTYMYGEQCRKCEIHSCYHSNCAPEEEDRQRKQCIWKAWDNCVEKHSHCTQTRLGGDCEWSPCSSCLQRLCLASEP